VIRDLRNYIFALRPGAAADQQLDRTLRELAEGFRESGVTVDVTTDPRAVSRLAGRATDVVQAAREALSNAVRHSRGNAVHISLAGSGDEAILEVADNGSGFDVQARRGGGHGLGNLESRAQALGGSLDIESVPGRGTWVRIVIPV
jgi:signal transduction histidine kinase